MQELKATVPKFPLYIINFIASLTAAILSDIVVTTISITAAVVGLTASSVLIGFSTFFVLYTVARLVSHIADTIGFSAIAVERSADKISTAIAQSAIDSETPVYKVEAE